MIIWLNSKDELFQLFVDITYFIKMKGDFMTSNDKLNPEINIEYPDFDTLPEKVKEKYESLPTKVNAFRMFGHSPGTYVELIDLTNAIFKNLNLSDYYKELLVLLVAGYEDNDYEWAQHVVIGQSAGINEAQILAISEQRFEDDNVFSNIEQSILRFGRFVLKNGKVPSVVFKHTLEDFSLEELTDAIIVIGYYQMISNIIRTLNLPIDQQEHGNWVKK